MKDIQPAPPTRCTCGHKRAIDHPGGGPCRLCNECRGFVPEQVPPVRRPA